MYNILNYGAISDKKTINTKSIQAAIDACAENGGGRVTVPAGDFVTGSVFLKSNVELHLESGATLWASRDMNDYNPEDAYEQNWSSGHENWTAQHLIIAVEEKNVSLSGNGVIDGSGDFFFGAPVFDKDWMDGYAWRYGFTVVKDTKKLRPGQTVCFIECQEVKVTDITIRNTPCWACYFYGCENVQVRGCKIYNPPTFANADGIDIDCCRHVTVSDCIVLTGDDGITVRCVSKRLKKIKPCEYVTVSNCVIRASACGMRFGVGSGEIKNVRVRGLIIEDAGRAFLLQSRYSPACSGKLENIDVSDVTVEKTGSAIFVIANGEGFVKNATFSNMRINSYTGCIIEAEKGLEVENITLRNIDLTVNCEEDNFIETENSRQIKRRHVINVNNTKNVTLDGVRLFYGDKAFDRWDGALFESENRNFTVKNCNF